MAILEKTNQIDSYLEKLKKEEQQKKRKRILLPVGFCTVLALSVFAWQQKSGTQGGGLNVSPNGEKGKRMMTTFVESPDQFPSENTTPEDQMEGVPEEGTETEEGDTPSQEATKRKKKKKADDTWEDHPYLSKPYTLPAGVVPENLVDPFKKEESSTATKGETAATNPAFPGGKAALGTFLQNNLKYPQSAYDNKVEGKVRVVLSVDEAGNITNTKILNPIGHGCEEEVRRVVDAMPKWQPATTNGKATAGNYTLAVTFKMPK